MTNELTRKEFLRTVATVGSAAIVGSACASTSSTSVSGDLVATSIRPYGTYWEYSLCRAAHRRFFARVNATTGAPLSLPSQEVDSFDDFIISFINTHEPVLAEKDADHWGGGSEYLLAAPRGASLPDLAKSLARSTAKKLSGSGAMYLGIADPSKMSEAEIAARVQLNAEYMRFTNLDYYPYSFAQMILATAVVNEPAAKTLSSLFGSWVAAKPKSLTDHEQDVADHFVSYLAGGIADDTPPGDPIGDVTAIGYMGVPHTYATKVIRAANYAFAGRFTSDQLYGSDTQNSYMMLEAAYRYPN